MQNTKKKTSTYLDNVSQFHGNVLPRWNFINIFHSFMIVFRALCGEWIESMFESTLVNDATTSIIYFCALALIGSFAVSYYFVIFQSFFSFISIYSYFWLCWADTWYLNFLFLSIFAFKCINWSACAIYWFCQK